MAIVFIGTEFESKMQMGLLVILVASIIDYMIGSVFPPNENMALRGATGYSCKLAAKCFVAIGRLIRNWLDYRINSIL